MESEYVLAPLRFIDLEQDKNYQVLINRNEAIFFSSDGNQIERDFLKLPEVFVLVLEEDKDRVFKVISERDDLPLNKNLFIINKDNKVIYSCKTNELKNFYRINDSSIILGIKDIAPEDTILTPQTEIGLLIFDNKLTNNKFCGAIGDYFLFKDINSSYYLYAIERDWVPDEEKNKFEYDEDKWEYKINKIYFHFIRPYFSNFIVIWRTRGPYLSYHRVNVITIEGEEHQELVIDSYESTYEWSNKHIEFSIDCDNSYIKWNNWKDEIQIIATDESIILHQININKDNTGFTIVLKYDGNYPKFQLKNKKRLGSYYNDRISLYSNSLIKISNIVYNENGSVLIDNSANRYLMKYESYKNEYVILSRNLGEPIIRSEIKRNFLRDGVIRLNDLKVIIPFNFNKIEYWVVKKRKYEFSNDTSQELYFKCIIEWPSEDGIKEYIGLCKEEKLILPCNYKGIKATDIKAQNIIIFESYDEKKGVIYEDIVVAQCNYIEYKELGYYLKLQRPDGKWDILYLYKKAKLFHCFDNIILPEIGIGNEKIISDDILIVEKEGKFGIISYGEQRIPCNYDEIKVINATKFKHRTYNNSLPETKPFWFAIRKGENWGLYGNFQNDGLGYESGTIYKTVNVLNWYNISGENDWHSSEHFIVFLDNKCIKPLGIGVPFTNDSELKFKGYLDSNTLIFSNEGGSIVEFFDLKGNSKEMIIMNHDDLKYYNRNDDKEKDEHEKYAYSKLNYYRCFSNVQQVYSFKDKDVINNPYYFEPIEIEDEDEDEEENDKGDYNYGNEDDYDYDRDTYYALGGDDYDSFKENGGNIDDMMDGMGF